VGKVELLNRVAVNQLSNHSQPPIGIDFKVKIMNYNNSKVKLKLWDTAGQKKYRAITQTFYKDADAIVMVYGCDNRQSFKDISSDWLDDVKQYANKNSVLVLVGNKTNNEENRQVTYTEGQSLAESIKDCPFYELSAKDGSNEIDIVFDKLGQSLLQRSLETTKPLNVPQKKNIVEEKKTVPDDKKIKPFKYVIIGDSAVGKTCIMRRLCHNTFSESFISTLGLDYALFPFDVDGLSCKAQLWDTAGRERFRTITTAYYKGANALIMVYDCTSRDSFDSVMQNWWKQIKEYKPEEALVVIVGNKNDDESNRQVSYDEGLSFANSIGCLFLETSAKKDVGDLKQAIVTISKEIRLKKPETPVPTPKPEITIKQEVEPEALETLAYLFFMEAVVLATIVLKLLSN
jgi:Ras-related protein Rab-1A